MHASDIPKTHDKDTVLGLTADRLSGGPKKALALYKVLGIKI